MMWAVLSRQVRRRNELKQRKAQASALRRQASLEASRDRLGDNVVRLH
jgi:hypothetical protein